MVRKKSPKRRRKSSGSKKRLDAVDTQLRRIRLDLTNHTKILNSHAYKLSEIENSARQSSSNSRFDEKLREIGRLDRVTDKMEMDISKILYDINICKSNFTKLYHNVSKIELSLPVIKSLDTLEDIVQKNRETLEEKSKNITENAFRINEIVKLLENGFLPDSTVSTILQPKSKKERNKDKNAKTQRQIQLPGGHEKSKKNENCK